MFKKPILYSILFLKCPQCRQGEFLEANPYNLSNFNKVKESCPKCNLKYSLEPAFYTGAMYVSYGVGVAIAVATYALTVIFGFDLGPTGILLSIIGTLIITMPYIGAVSKAIWAHFFFKYNPEIAKKVSDDSKT